MTFKKTDSSKSSNMRKRVLIFVLFVFLDGSCKLIENTNFKVVIMHLVEVSKTRLGGVHFTMPKAVNGQGRTSCLYVTYSLMCTYKIQKMSLWRMRFLQCSAVGGYYLIVIAYTKSNGSQLLMAGFLVCLTFRVSNTKSRSEQTPGNLFHPHDKNVTVYLNSSSM